jgi:hypothetical protein
MGGRLAPGGEGDSPDSDINAGGVQGDELVGFVEARSPVFLAVAAAATVVAVAHA